VDVHYSSRTLLGLSPHVKLQWTTTTVVSWVDRRRPIVGENVATTASEEMGARLRQVRDLRRLPLSKVASKADISTAYLQRLEAGSVKQPSPNILYQLAKALDLDYAELMRLAGYIVPNDQKDRRRRRNELTHSLSSEALTEAEADELASYLEWYRSRASR
jgi:transcriptional regulator with XRE-family HTH domain